MRTIGNIIWFFLGGLFGFLGWGIIGVLWCITIIGIPFGKQCFKIAALSLAPFGKEIVDGGGTTSFLANVIWAIFFGWELFLGHLLSALLLCLTIVGIPFAKQALKLAMISFVPFGKKIVKIS